MKHVHRIKRSVIPWRGAVFSGGGEFNLGVIAMLCLSGRLFYLDCTSRMCDSQWVEHSTWSLVSTRLLLSIVQEVQTVLVLDTIFHSINLTASIPIITSKKKIIITTNPTRWRFVVFFSPPQPLVGWLVWHKKSLAFCLGWLAWSRIVVSSIRLAHSLSEEALFYSLLLQPHARESLNSATHDNETGGGTAPLKNTYLLVFTSVWRVPRH